MKKRIFSFVVMVITLVAIIAFGVPNIKDNSKTGMEFNGGFDILYEMWVSARLSRYTLV